MFYLCRHFYTKVFPKSNTCSFSEKKICSLMVDKTYIQGLQCLLAFLFMNKPRGVLNSFLSTICMLPEKYYVYYTV